MKRFRLLLMSIVSLSLVAISGQVAFSDSKSAELLQKHIEKVKHKNPQKYEAMVKAAGGTITDCFSCHSDIFKETTRPQKNQAR